MRICVCVKEVPPSVVPRKLADDGSLVRGTSGQLNQPDVHALEEALRVRDVFKGEVVTVTMSVQHATDPLRHALAMGADRAVLVNDEAIAGSDLVATARVLGAALEREAPDMVMFGWEATDSNGAMLWAAVGERLGMPVLSRAWELSVADGVVTAKRQMEYGFDVVAVRLPAVVALSGVTNAPRHPQLKAVVASKRKEIESASLMDLGVPAGLVGTAGSLTSTLRLAPPAARDRAHVIEDAEDAPQQLLSFLEQRGAI